MIEASVDVLVVKTQSNDTFPYDCLKVLPPVSSMMFFCIFLLISVTLSCNLGLRERALYQQTVCLSINFISIGVIALILFLLFLTSIT